MVFLPRTPGVLGLLLLLLALAGPASAFSFAKVCSGDEESGGLPNEVTKTITTDNGNSERNFSGGGDFMYCTAVTPDGKLGIGGGQESVLIVWNIENGQQVRTFEAPKPAGDKTEAGKKETAKK